MANLHILAVNVELKNKNFGDFLIKKRQLPT